MQKNIGEILLRSGKPLLKMWGVDVPPQVRPYTKHCHTQFEISVVEQGTGTYQTERGTYPMEQGDVFVFSSNEIHSITAVGSGGLSITNLQFDPRYLGEEFFESTGENNLSFCFFHALSFRNRIVAEKAESIRQHHSAIKEEFLQKRSQHSLSVRAHLQLILVELLRNHGYQDPDTLRCGHGDMLKVFDYIDRHLTEEITLGMVAEAAGLSPNYLSHLFKKVNGVSLWEYITASRVERASQLICSHGRGMTMLEIALQCGFNNTASFNKAFKKHKGITPRELRNDPALLFF